MVALIEKVKIRPGDSLLIKFPKLTIFFLKNLWININYLLSFHLKTSKLPENKRKVYVNYWLFENCMFEFPSNETKQGKPTMFEPKDVHAFSRM
jgi:hypothetical protein